jgi:hypothetical protein
LIFKVTKPLPITLVLLITLGVALVVVLLKFGTIDPCGIVRAEARQEAEREGGFGVVAAALPDGVIDSIIAARYGPLSPGRCIAIALAFRGTPSQAPAARQQRTSAPIKPQNHQQSTFAPSQSAAEMFKQAGVRANAAIMECKNKRLSGELKTYEASAECSNPRIIEAYQEAGYRYMDLVSLMTAKRLELAEEIDQGKITEAQAQLEFAQFMTGIADEERQRDSGQR